MLEFIENNESTVRLGFFVGILMLMWLWETLSPRRALSVSRLFRWGNNLGIVVLNTLVLRVVFPAAAVGMAAIAQKNGWGLVSILEWHPLFIVIFSIIVLDFMIWLQHVAVHAIPVFWRLHRVHHADRDYDTTTGLRFHPLEILLSMVIKFIVIIALGPPVVAVILFEVILNGMAMFNHGNVRLPLPLDKVLRILFVTPDMHRVHHSVEDDEANSNFGFNLSIWDRLFGTYVDQPRGGHEAMTIGIEGFEEKNDVNRIDGMLLLPFKGKMSGYVINRRTWK
ncbi:MAG: sterol desaturase family protein [Gammaproteobacteria bacterium]|nr:sterol desaturase family protein [Gammaproteobacteria bacterium]